MQVIYDDPVMSQMFNQLDPNRQEQVKGLVNKMAKQDVPLTPERIALFRKYDGMFEKPESRQEAFNLDLSKLDLTAHQLSQLQAHKDKVIAKQQGDVRILHAIGITKDILKGASITSGSDDEFEFIGAMKERIQNYEAIHKTYPKDDQIRAWGTDLVASHGGFLGLFSSFNFHPEDQFVKEYTQAYKTMPFNKSAKEPGPEELARAYQYALTHPNWKKELEQ